MINIAISDHTALVVFWVTFSRWLAILFQIPIFDNQSVPAIVKILSAFMITYVFYPYVSDVVTKDVLLLGDNAFWALTILNVIIGLVIGFLVKSILNTFIAAGAVITQQIGFGAIRYFDPSASQQVGPFEKMIQLTVVVTIISSGCLIPMLKGGLMSFDTINAYSVAKLSNSPLFFVEMFKSIFLSALMLASPIIFTNALVMCVLGVIARTVPQMNVLMVSFVVNIGMGLLVFSLISFEFFSVAYDIYVEKLGEWFQFIT